MTTNTVESDASLGANGRTGSKAEALQQTRNLLQTSPALAIQQAQIIIEGDRQ